MTATFPEPAPSLAPPRFLHLVSAPVSAPPYDDELPAGPQLRLVPALPPVAPRRLPRPLISPVTEMQELDAWLAAERTPTADLPPTRPYARSLVQVLVEVLAGVRPLAQLRRETTPELYASIESSLARSPRPAGSRPDGRAVRSVHVQERPEGIVEVCATVVRAGRVAALALKLEGQDGRWRCTELAGL